MILYDAMGHFACLMARWEIAVYFWNHWANHIWPSFASPITYDAFWSVWFFIAVGLIILGRKTK